MVPSMGLQIYLKWFSQSKTLHEPPLNETEQLCDWASEWWRERESENERKWILKAEPFVWQGIRGGWHRPVELGEKKGP